MKTRTQVRLWIVLLCLIIVLGTGLFWINNTLQGKSDYIQDTLTQTLGFPVRFKKISLGWQGLSPAISLKEFSIQNKAHTKSILTIQKISIVPNFFAFFGQTLKIEKIYLRKMRLGLVLTNNHSIEIEGFQQLGAVNNEKDEDSIHSIQTIQKLVSKLGQFKAFILDKCYFDWKTPYVSFTQIVSGNIELDKNQEWQFNGKHKIDFHNEMNMPYMALHFGFDPLFTHFMIDSENAYLKAHCEFLDLAKSPHMNCQFKAGPINLPWVQQKLSLGQRAPEWLRWVKDALPLGTIRSTVLSLKGPLDNIEWAGETSVEDAQFIFNPEWPAIEDTNALVSYNKEGVHILLEDGKINKIPVQSVTGIIKPIGTPAPTILIVNGNVYSTFEEGLQYLMLTPLKNSLAVPLQTLSPIGKIDLNLNLIIPLGKGPVKVGGSLTTDNATFTIYDKKTKLTEVSGIFNFTEDSLEGTGIHAELKQEPIIFDVLLSPKDPTQLKIKANTELDIAWFKKDKPHPILEYLSGRTKATVLLDVPWKTATLKEDDKKQTKSEIKGTVTSDLVGIESTLPDPLSKARDKVAPSILKFVLGNDERKGSLTIEDMLNANFVLKRKMNRWSIKGVSIALGNQKAEAVGNGVIIGGEMPLLTVEVWKNFQKELSTKASINMPITLHLFSKQFEMDGVQLANVWLNHSYQDGDNVWGLDGESIKGTITLPTDADKKYSFNLDFLNYSEDMFNKDNMTSLLKDDTYYPVTFYCRNLRFKNLYIGETSFKLTPTDTGYKLNQLTIKTQYSSLQGSGVWNFINTDKKTSFSGQLQTSHIGETLKHFGISSPVQDAKGNVRFDLSWSGDPFDFDPAKAKGSGEVSLSNGRILGVNPGLGRVLGLLNLDNIKSRLRLDFSDLFKKGFVFDQLATNITLANGRAHTDGLFINGPAAQIKIEGDAKISDKTLNLNMVVIPKVGGTLPLAAGLMTGNPAVGVGVWLFDKVIGSRKFNIIQHHYAVTGTWDSPHIQDLDKQ